MAEVRALQDVGQFTESIDELREILAVAPNLPEANYRLGIALVQTGEPSRAVWALQKASESPEYAIVAGLMLASATYSLQNHEEAVRAATKVLEIDPERMVALLIRAQARLGARQHEEAWEDTQRLVELYPDEYRVRVLEAALLMDMNRLEEAEIANNRLKEMGAASGDPQIANRSCLAPAFFANDNLRDVERAEELYEDCLEKFPTDSFVVGQSMKFFDQIGKPERSTELIRRSVEAAPEALSLRVNLANRLVRAGKPEEGEQVLLEAVESFGSAAAWNLLSSFYRRTQDPAKALGAIEKVIELSGGGGDPLRFTQADRAEEVMKSLDEPTYARLIQGRILLERGDAKAALAEFDHGIRHWPNNAGARYLAALAAYELGDFERAMSELREAVRVEPGATEAPLLLASLHFARGEYSLATSFVRIYVRGPARAQLVQAYTVGIRALVALKQYEAARKTVESLEKVPEAGHAPLIELAEIDRAEKGIEAAIERIEKSGEDLTDPDNGELLRTLAGHLSAAGRIDAALAKVDAALRRNADSSPHHELRGNLLGQLKRAAEARAAYAKALELDPDNAVAIAGAATLAARDGDLPGAVEGFDRAAELAPDQHSFAYSAAQLSLSSGDKAGAETRLRELIRRAPGHAGARNDLAWILGERGEELDLALALAEEARRIDPSPDMLDTLGYVHLKRDEPSAAVAALELALEGRSDSPSIRYRLGTALGRAGDTERARKMLQIALEAGAFPEAEAARRELARLEQP
jgi:tetratricopeptide (TPR) repeat protein